MTTAPMTVVCKSALCLTRRLLNDPPTTVNVTRTIGSIGKYLCPDRVVVLFLQYCWCLKFVGKRVLPQQAQGLFAVAWTTAGLRRDETSAAGIVVWHVERREGK